jgi:hypothetical protein
MAAKRRKKHKNKKFRACKFSMLHRTKIGILTFYESINHSTSKLLNKVCTKVFDGEIMQIDGLFVKEKMLYSKNIIP